MATVIFNGGDAAATSSYEDGALPVAGDDLWFATSATDVTAGFAALAAIALSELHIPAGYSGEFDDDLQVDADRIWIGEHFGSTQSGAVPSGSGCIRLDLQGDSIVEVIRTAGSSSSDYSPPVRFIGGSAQTRINVRSGLVGVAVGGPEETASLEMVETAVGAEAIVGPGVTLLGASNKGGRMLINCPVTGATNSSGTMMLEGDATGATGQVTADGGTVISNAARTISNVIVNDGATVDFTQSAVDRTVTTLTINGGRVLIDRLDVTVTSLPINGRREITVSEI